MAGLNTALNAARSTSAELGLRGRGRDGLWSATLFDIYRPKSGAEAAAGMSAQEKSLAVRLVMGSAQETLTDERIDAAVKAVLDRLQPDLGARLRA